MRGRKLRKFTSYRLNNRPDLPTWVRLGETGLGVWRCPRGYDRMGAWMPVRPRLRIGRRTWVLLPLKKETGEVSGYSGGS